MRSLRSSRHLPFLTAFTLITLAACASSPLGRRQLELLPESQVDQMGAQSFSDLKTKTPIENDPKINQYVKCIAVPVTQAAASQLDVKNWEIVVFRSNQINAFALPGGKIGVYTGILPVTKTDAQLATVLAHEVGHVIAKHGNERVSQQMITMGGLAVADLLSGSASPAKKQIMMAGLGLGAQYGLILPFSRTQESEADLVGLDLMAQAGFDPRQSVELWKNMTASAGSGPPQWMSDHPSNENRMQALQDHMGDALSKYQAAQNAGHRPHCTL